MNAKLIIFDCDGVLVDSETLAEKSLFECLNAHGFPIDESWAGRYHGVSTKDMLANIEMRYQRKVPENLHTIISQHARDLFAKELKAMDGISELIKGLAVKKCVASNGSLRGVEHSLKIVKLWDSLEPHIFSAEQVKRGKPYPDLFLFAANQMKIKPEHCLVIEDSIPGVQAARAAGMRVIGFFGASNCNEGHGDRLRKEGAEQVFPDMKSLAKALISNQETAA
jgi:HAD superfamily hydrolase (TIGR01509 family)